jgi:hypothetical protein
MGKSPKSIFPVVIPGPTLSDTSKGKTRIEEMHDGVVNAATAR